MFITMAAFRSVRCMQLLKSTLPVSRRLTAAKCSIVPMSIVLGTFACKQSGNRVLCDGEKLKPPDPAKLSHSYLIRNAASQTINSALILLNQTIVALEETEKVYAMALRKLKVLLEYNLTVLGDPLREEHAWTEIIKIKGDIVTLKQQKEELEFVYENAEKTVYAASETAFSAGAEQISEIANEMLFAAKLTRDKNGQKSKRLEKEIVKMEVETIEKTMEAQKRRAAQKDTSENETDILENTDESNVDQEMNDEDNTS